MGTLKTGYAKVCITPPLGIDITGYFQKRYADKVLDDLYAVALALELDGKRAVFVNIDLLTIRANGADIIREYVSEKTGLPMEAIYLGCTHTHTGPLADPTAEGKLEVHYFEELKLKICDAIVSAFSELKASDVSFGVSTAPRISFGRRFRMKDGSVRTNPGVNNPDILEPIGEIDERVSVVRFDRENADNIVLVNFGTHPDTIGGTSISADWPGFVRTTLEAAIGDAKAVFFNGAQGDVNHVNVFPRPGDSNGMFHDFDDVDRGYLHAKHMGNVVAGAVLQVYEKLAPANVDSIRFVEKKIKIPANVPTPEELPIAIKYNDLHKAGRDDEIPFGGMALTTVLADAARKVRLKDGPEFFELSLTAIAIGNIAFIGIPGEPFSKIGIELKKNPKFDLVIPTALTNGSKGYFPSKDAYDEGGYETATSSFKAGVAEIIIEEGNKLLNSL